MDRRLTGSTDLRLDEDSPVLREIVPSLQPQAHGARILLTIRPAFNPWDNPAAQDLIINLTAIHPEKSRITNLIF